MDINIGMSAAKAAEWAKEIREQALQAMKDGDGDTPRTFSVEAYAENNIGGKEITLVVSNDDMERDEVADAIIIDLED